MRQKVYTSLQLSPDAENKFKGLQALLKASEEKVLALQHDDI